MTDISAIGPKELTACSYVQIISATKYIIRRERTRDHVDFLLSSRCWPLVYVVHVDMASDVVALEVREPETFLSTCFLDGALASSWSPPLYLRKCWSQ